MKCYFTLCFISFSLVCSAQWTPIDTVIGHYSQLFYSTEYLSKSFNFYKNNRISVVTKFSSNPSPSSSSCSSNLNVTYNDGASWSNIFSCSAEWGCTIGDVECPSIDTVFAISGCKYFGPAFIRTENGGSTFSTISNGGYEMFFHNGRNGYAARGNFFFRYLIDTLFSIDTIVGANFSKFEFTENGIGYTLLKKPVNSYSNSIAISTNDGYEWNSIFEDTTIIFKDIDVISDSVCYVTCDSGRFYKTTDMGFSWELHSPFVKEIKSMSFFNKDVGLAIVANRLYKTLDGGSNWIYTTFQDGFLLDKVETTEDAVAYLVGIHTTENHDYIFTEYTKHYVILKSLNQGWMPPTETLKMYPNPNSGLFTVKVPEEFQDEDNVSLFIYDNIGRLIIQNQVDNLFGKIDLNMSFNKEGLYFVNISNENKSYSGKIIITK